MVPKISQGLPDGQITDFLSIPLRKNILIFRNPNQGYIHSVPSHRGAARDRYGRGAGCGGRSGVRRAIGARTNGAEADGEVVWS
jgi:hypothetical protein